MENGVLTISGSRAATARDERNGYRRVERVAGRFFRRFTLPDTANAEGITAKSTHGVLEVIIPKHDRVMPRPCGPLRHPRCDGGRTAVVRHRLYRRSKEPLSGWNIQQPHRNTKI